jgi:hypothetical protein
MHQQRPDVPTTLDAVVTFLTSELHGQVRDKGLAFRVLIAANLLMQSAALLRAEPQRSERDAQRLQTLLAALKSPAGHPESDTPLRVLSECIARATPEQQALLMTELTASLADTLACNSPAFALDEAIE